MPYVDNSEQTEGALRVWWIPQIPMKAFHRAVADLSQAKLLLDTLAYYDMFQYENNIKPDYSNGGGLEVYEDGEWNEWTDEFGYDIDEWIKNNDLETEESK
jgi:hypothetical protein